MTDTKQPLDDIDGSLGQTGSHDCLSVLTSTLAPLGVTDLWLTRMDGMPLCSSTPEGPPDLKKWMCEDNTLDMVRESVETYLVRVAVGCENGGGGMLITRFRDPSPT
ncbi:MAG: hypothetical protein V3R58_03645, partial [candidate division NC10 bacterium]